jgi:hypothetical protein
MNDRQKPASSAIPGLADPALPAGARLGTFELQRVIARSASGIVYLAIDHALAQTVAILEYLPARLVQRDSGLRLRATDVWHEEVIARGLRAFIDEARLLAHCDHPALVRVNQLFEANGSAYRVMPYYAGRRLLDLRRGMPEAPDEASLRALLDDLLGALEAIHRGGRVHGGVTPGNILLLGDDRPLLLGPGAAAREIGSDLVDSLMASLETALDAGPAAHRPSGSMADLYALAEVTRFCITGSLPAAPAPERSHETTAEVIARSFEAAARPRYSAELLSTLDAAMSPFTEDWPLSAAQFRTWLARGAPRATPRSASPYAAADGAAPARAPAAAPAALPPIAAATSGAPRRAAPPDPTTIRAPTEPPTAAMTTDRAPWLAPPVHAARRTQRRHKLAMGAALAGLAIVVLGVVSGAWDQVPEIALDRLTLLGGLRSTEPAGPLAPPEASPRETAAAPAAGAASASVTAAVSNALPASAVAAPPAAQAIASMAAPADPPATAAAATPDKVAVAPPLPTPAQRGARATGARLTAAAGGPRAACSTKTEFALYRCMQQQCESPRWYAHPQCIRLRATDRAQ